jgi:hypothetical protein
MALIFQLQIEKELAVSEFLEHIVVDKTVNWQRLRNVLVCYYYTFCAQVLIILQSYSSSDNKLKAAYWIYQAFSKEEIKFLVDLNKTHTNWKDDPWNSTKLQTTHFFNATLFIRKEAMKLMVVDKMKSEQEVNDFCARKMVGELAEKICEHKKLPKSTITVDVKNQVYCQFL